MRKGRLFSIIVALIFISSCSSFTGELRTLTTPDYEIALPDWLEETNDLAPHAHFQFKSAYRNTYGIIVKEAKTDTAFNQYQQKSVNVLRNFKEMTNLLVTDSSYSKNYIALELMGDIESEKVFYWHNTYQTDTHYYQLVIWTRSYDRKQKYTPVIEDIITSFKLKR